MTARAARECVLEVVRSVARRYGYDEGDLIGSRRFRRIAEARHVVCWIVRQHGFSYPEIAWQMGRDHTTVMHSVRTVAANARLLSVAVSLDPERARVRVA